MENLIQNEVKSAEIFYNLGNLYQSRNLTDDSIDMYQKALELNESHEDSAYNLSLLLMKEKRFLEANDFLARLLTLDNGNEAHKIAYISNCRSLGWHSEARALVHSIKEDKLSAPELNELGLLFINDAEVTRSIDYFTRAIDLDPFLLGPVLNLGTVLEKSNKLTELAQLISDNIRNHGASDNFKLLEASYLLRIKEFERARKILDSILVDNLLDDLLVRYHQSLFKLNDYFKKFDSAFDNLVSMNNIIARSCQYDRSKAVSYRTKHKKINDKLRLTHKVNFKSSVDDAPIFIVGFPRSGTTLLGTMLSVLPCIHVSDEKPYGRELTQYLENAGLTPPFENGLDPRLQVEAADFYQSRLSSESASLNETMMIDKMPLNILNIPTIISVYPHAKFLVCIRHPLDVLISNWSQNYVLNESMMNMVELDDIAELYEITMECLCLCMDKYNLNFHIIKYESLVTDPEFETRQILKFLEVPWNSKILAHQDHIARKKRISTPSYSQVVEPVYVSSKFKWVNYDSHLSNYKVKLGKWITRFDYQ
jgi:tetratricopeptide (TPR) repeat protein